MDISSNGLATLVISEERGQDYRTILHPEQQLFLSLETNVDPTVFLSEDERYKMWHEEWKECLRIALRVRSSGITPVLFIYNGGEVSEAELLAWAKQGLTCIIVRDSGRCADKYASYESWLKANPTVHVCQRSVDSISAKLADLGVIDPTQAYSRKTRKIA